jgi:hypothetical protein
MERSEHAAIKVEATTPSSIYTGAASLALKAASICVSPVYSCFNTDGGDNSSVTASERSISSTRFYVDPFEHRRLH